MEKSMRACTARRKKSSASDNRPWSWYQQWTYRNFGPSRGGNTHVGLRKNIVEMEFLRAKVHAELKKLSEVLEDLGQVQGCC